MKTCNFNGQSLPVSSIDDDGIEEGKAYDLTEYGNDGVYVHLIDGGAGTFDTDEEGEITVVGEPLPLEESKSNVVDLSFISKAAAITEKDVAKKKRQNAAAQAEEKPTSRKKGSSKRIAGHEKLTLDHNDDDDLLVRLIKTHVNEGHFTLEQIYDAIGDNSTGYNMFYGLKTRKTMTIESFQRWIEILGGEFDIVITFPESSGE